ncbi:TPA: hypothetical protein I7139_24165 [Vibrio vulnificus]|nr:hypothetical protein [Vibrio vulnificus]
MLKIEKIHCNTCGSKTNHELKSSHSKHEYDEVDIGDENYISWYEESDFLFWVCRGCRARA